jgi:hypothetical protein
MKSNPILAAVVALAAVAPALGSSACGLIEGYRHCSDADPIRSSLLPTRLSATGLFADVPGDVLATGVRPYLPRFELWSDGATKRRWIWLPPGQSIDTADMDNWSFPVGTKLWKEFTRDGVRVETRLLARTGPGMADWAAVAYLWNDQGTDAVAVPDGVEDARGTPHDVPAASECAGCHGGRRSRVLGFSAVQLSYPAEPGMLGLDGLSTAGLLTTGPVAPRTLQATKETTAALGYLHANCSHCHNQERPSRSDGFRCFDPEKSFDFSLHWRELGAPEDTATYRTALGSVIKPGRPGDSDVIKRISSRDRFPPSMPPLASKKVDDQGIAVLNAWIGSL